MSSSPAPSDRDAHVAASNVGSSTPRCNETPESLVATKCDGSRDCEADQHLHGCYADRGNCERPDEHGRSAALTPEDVVRQTSRPRLPLGWDETHLAAYRDGYSDALLWALEHDHDEIEAVLDDPE